MIVNGLKNEEHISHTCRFQQKSKLMLQLKVAGFLYVVKLAHFTSQRFTYSHRLKTEINIHVQFFQNGSEKYSSNWFHHRLK